MKNELVELWGYAGYADILHQSSWIVREIKRLNTDLKSLSKIPVSRRTSPSFLEKEAGFLATLPKLFNITVESLRYTQLITSEDRDFLFNHWWKHISSTPDLAAQKAVNIKFTMSGETTCVQGEDLSPFIIHAAILYSTFYFMSSISQHS